MENINWNSKTYKEFVEYLKSIGDIDYKKFHSSLVLNSKYEMIGIRLPIMRNIAKAIIKGEVCFGKTKEDIKEKCKGSMHSNDYITNIEQFLKVAKDEYYEEVMIQGLVIAGIKDEEEFYKYFTNHIKKIDNWALCDTFCNLIKIVRKYEEKYFAEAVKLALDDEEFISRTGLVTILSHFVNQKNIETIINTLNKIKSDKFYINMAEAWLVCELYIKFPKQTMEFLKKNKLNKFTLNKSISKIHDSYRVSKEEKEYLNTLRK